MFHPGIFTILCSIIACSFGFTMDRSVHVSSTWDTAPSLDSYRRILGNSTLNSKMQVTDMNKILQATNAKVSTKLTENQMREKRSTTEFIDAGTKIVNVAPEMKINTFDSSEKNISASSAFRNVILLLIDKMDQDEKKGEDLWKNYKEKLPFAIEGFLQNCGNKIETSFPLNVLISDDVEKDCDCQRILHSNVEELLFWARHMRGMTTGVVSGSNFSILSSPKSEFDGSNKSDAKLELHKSNVWQMIDLSDRTKSVPSLVMTDDSKLKETTNDSTWDLFDVFSKIRIAFFRLLLESLGKNDRASENGFSSRKLLSLKPTVVNLIGDIIKKLRSMPNNKGYMLIATVPSNEQAAVVDLVQNEISSKDTLLVMLQICTRNKNSVPFIAQGPNNKILREARSISELSIAIKKAVLSDCRDSECMKRSIRDTSIISSMPIEIFSQELSAQKRSSKNKDAADKLDAILTEEAITLRKRSESEARFHKEQHYTASLQQSVS